MFHKLRSQGKERAILEDYERGLKVREILGKHRVSIRLFYYLLGKHRLPLREIGGRYVPSEPDVCKVGKRGMVYLPKIFRPKPGTILRWKEKEERKYEVTVET